MKINYLKIKKILTIILTTTLICCHNNKSNNKQKLIVTTNTIDYKENDKQNKKTLVKNKKKNKKNQRRRILNSNKHKQNNDDENKEINIDYDKQISNENEKQLNTEIVDNKETTEINKDQEIVDNKETTEINKDQEIADHKETVEVNKDQIVDEIKRKIDNIDIDIINNKKKINSEKIRFERCQKIIDEITSYNQQKYNDVYQILSPYQKKLIIKQKWLRHYHQSIFGFLLILLVNIIYFLLVVFISKSKEQKKFNYVCSIFCRHYFINYCLNRIFNNYNERMFNIINKLFINKRYKIKINNCLFIQQNKVGYFFYDHSMYFINDQQIYYYVPVIFDHTSNLLLDFLNVFYTVCFILWFNNGCFLGFCQSFCKSTFNYIKENYHINEIILKLNNADLDGTDNKVIKKFYQIKKRDGRKFVYALFCFVMIFFDYAHTFFNGEINGEKNKITNLFKALFYCQHHTNEAIKNIFKSLPLIRNHYYTQPSLFRFWHLIFLLIEILYIIIILLFLSIFYDHKLKHKLLFLEPFKPFNFFKKKNNNNNNDEEDAEFYKIRRELLSEYNKYNNVYNNVFDINDNNDNNKIQQIMNKYEIMYKISCCFII